jgi:hypothetical protein
MSKGSIQRPCDPKKFAEGWERAFSSRRNSKQDAMPHLIDAWNDLEWISERMRDGMTEKDQALLDRARNALDELTKDEA